MGKKRKPVRKPRYEDISEVQTRMAGEAMTDDQVLEAVADQLLSDIQGKTREDELVQEALDYLPGRREELSQLLQMPKFQGMSNMDLAIKGEQYLDSLGRLQRDVPMPVIRNRGDDQYRYHTRYTTDPTTGQEIVTPALDGSGVPVTTVYGKGGYDSGADHQSESAMLNAGRLMGNTGVYNDPEGRGRADLRFTDEDNNSLQVDVMMRDLRKPEVELPLYTSLVPIRDDGREALEFDRSKRAYNHVDQLIDAQLDLQGNKNVFGAVEQLVKDGKLGRRAELRAGKLLRSSTDFNKPEDIYDGLLMPGYEGDIASLPMRNARAPFNVPTAPDSIEYVDLKQALDAYIENADTIDSKRVVNYGSPKARPTGKYERMQVKPKLPAVPEMGIVDATVEHPLLQQLLSERAMQQRLV